MEPACISRGLPAFAGTSLHLLGSTCIPRDLAAFPGIFLHLLGSACISRDLAAFAGISLHFHLCYSHFNLQCPFLLIS